MHANPARTPDGDDGVRHFEQEAGAVLDRTAVAIVALVRAVLQELVEEIAVRAMHLDAVKTGCFGVLRAATKGLDDAQISPVSKARGVT